MNRISGDNALAQYASANTAQSKKTVGTPFRELLASATGSASISPTGATVAAKAVTPALSVASAVPAGAAKLVSDLNIALNAYGIGAPPSLRITTGPGGLQLDGDERNAKFQAMLKDNPALGQRLGDMLGTATLGRKAALNDAMTGFGGANPGGAMRDFLEGFKRSEEPQGFSISFNGASASVEERGDGGQGWEPVKNKGAFNSELLAAYAKYLVQFGVSTEKQEADSDTDADIDLKKKLAEAETD